MAQRTKNKKQGTNNNLLSVICYLLSKQTGFTLIELLVTIAIIASIMAVLFPNFMGIRQRARDTQRKSDLSQIQKALELYKLDQTTSAYPVPTILSVCNFCWSSGSDCDASGVNIYMRKVPCDPGSPVGGTPTPYIYSPESDILKYDMVACLENAVDPDKDASKYASCSQASYTLHEP